MTKKLDTNLPSDSLPLRDEEMSLGRYKKILLRLFLTSDLKNPKIWSELKKAKRNLLENISGDKLNNVHMNDINDIFWLYANIHKDIYVPPHLKKYLSEFSFKVGFSYGDVSPKTWIAFSVDEYLSFLKIIRHAIAPIKQNYDIWLPHAKALVKEATADDLADATEFGYENYKTALSADLDKLYKRTYTPSLINKKWDDIYVHIHNNNLGIYEIAEFFAITSYSSELIKQRDTLVEPYMGITVSLGDKQFILSDLLSLLKELDIATNIFKKI